MTKNIVMLLKLGIQKNISLIILYSMISYILHIETKRLKLIHKCCKIESRSDNILLTFSLVYNNILIIT